LKNKKSKEKACLAARFFCSCSFLAEAEEQDDNCNEDYPKQNVFTEKIASTVHRVTPFFVTGFFAGSFSLYEWSLFW
jgi:hypothetical protein